MSETLPLPAAAGARFVLEERAVFSRSLLWELQRRYFAERGVEAWRQGEVPHYIVSNPVVANGYAEIVLAFLRDHDRLAGDRDSGDEPLTLCELGAGSGRFAFHFLTRLHELCREAGVAVERFRYVLTDRAEGNLEFWRRHPSFQGFFERGLLDVAPFDVESSEELALERGGTTLAAGSLRRPLVVIANYLFDSIPQELLHVQSGRCRRCAVSLAMEEDPSGLDAAAQLARLQCQFEERTLEEPAYPEPWLNVLLAGYAEALHDTYLLFPAAGLRCLARLQALSRSGLLLLSADQGVHRMEDLDGQAEPTLLRHGSFSLRVNYHAIGAFCERRGGLSLFPRQPPAHLTVGCCLVVPGAREHRETRSAYRRKVEDFGPDDFYTIAWDARWLLDGLGVQELVAYLRLGRFDAHQLGRYLPRLTLLAPQVEGADREALLDVLDRVWDGYFPLGEELDLAHWIAGLLYTMDEYERALVFFERSIAVYGRDCGTLFNMAACHRLLGRVDRAQELLLLVLAHDPDNAAAAELLATIGAG
jgi:tetratricopeptide (TPR) repeat protein